jgi:tryptophan-rich sensory protein
MTQSTIGLALWIVVCLGAAALGSVFTTSSIPDWYGTLNKPTWTPPNAVFGPVWTVLYLMMAVAVWLVWRRGERVPVGVPLTLFGVQLIVNVMWSWLFFGMRLPGAAFVDVVALWCLILATIITFWPVAPLAGALLLPYFAWVTFASALNWAVWRMNA